MANLAVSAGVCGGPFLEFPYDPPGWTPERRDFMLAEGIRGRGLNHFYYGPYQLYRFWPERDRLPFMTGTLVSAGSSTGSVSNPRSAVPDRS